MASSEQFTNLRPGATLVEPLYGGSLDRVEGLVAGRQRLTCFEGSSTPGEQIVEGFYFGDFRLQGLRERICHEPTVEVNTPILNTVLTPTQKLFNMVLKRTALHRPKLQQPLHRLHSQTKTAPTQGLHSLARA